MVIRCGAGFHRKAQGAFHKIKKLKERYLAKSDPKTKAWAQISGSLVCIQLFASKTQCLNFSRTGIGNMGPSRPPARRKNWQVNLQRSYQWYLWINMRSLYILIQIMELLLLRET